VKFDKLIGKRIVLYNRKNFRFEGIVKDVDERFIEILDDLKKKPKLISINEVTEIEVGDNAA
jgi:hypothetical protein